MKRFLFFVVLFFVWLPACVFQEKLPSPVVQAQYAIVKIVIRGPGVQGTGFFIDQNTLVTNYHVIEFLRLQHAKIRFFHPTFHNPLKEIQFKRIKHLSALHDLAVLEVQGYEGPFLKLGSFLNDDVYAIGFPEGVFRKIKGGNIKQKDTLYFYEIVSYIPPIIGGASGSPLLNIKGEVIGITYASVTFLDKENEKTSNPKFVVFLEAKKVQYLIELFNTNELSLKKPKELILEEEFNIKQLAKAGNAEAQYKVGHIFFYIGEFDLAFNWILKAANQGHSAAIFFLAHMYAKGWGVEKNHDKAYEWREKNDEFYDWLLKE